MELQETNLITRLRYEVYHVVTRGKAFKDLNEQDIIQEAQKLYEKLLINDGIMLDTHLTQRLDISNDVPLKKFTQYLHHLVYVCVYLIYGSARADSLLNIENTVKLLPLLRSWTDNYHQKSNQELVNIDDGLFLEIEGLFHASFEQTMSVLSSLPLSSDKSAPLLELLKLMLGVARLFKSCFEHISAVLLKKHQMLLWEEVFPILFQYLELESALFKRSLPSHITDTLQSIAVEFRGLLESVFFTAKATTEIMDLKLLTTPNDIPVNQIEHLKTTGKLQLLADTKKNKGKRTGMQYFMDAFAHCCLMNPFAPIVPWEEKIKVVRLLCGLYRIASNKIRDIEDGNHEQTQDNSNATTSGNVKRAKRKYMENLGAELRSGRHNIARLFHFPLLIIDRLENRLLLLTEHHLVAGKELAEGEERDSLRNLALHYLTLKIELITFLRIQLEDRFLSQQSLFQKYFQFLQQDFLLLLENMRSLSASIASLPSITSSSSSASATTVSYNLNFQTGKINLSLTRFDCVRLQTLFVRYLQQVQSIRSNYAEKDLSQVIGIFFEDQTLSLSSKEDNKSGEIEIASIHLLYQNGLNSIVARYDESSPNEGCLIEYYSAGIDFILAMIDLYAQLRDLPLLLALFIHLAKSYPNSSIEIILNSVIVRERLVQKLAVIPQGQWKTILQNLLALDATIQERENVTSAQVRDASPLSSLPNLIITEVILSAALNAQFRDLGKELIDLVYREVLELLLNLKGSLSTPINERKAVEREATLNLLSATLQFSSRYFHHSNALHRTEIIQRGEEEEESVQLYSLVELQLIPLLRTVDEAILEPLSSSSVRSEKKKGKKAEIQRSPSSTLFTAVLRVKLSIYQLLVCDHHQLHSIASLAARNSSNSIDEIRDSFCALIGIIGSDQPRILTLCVFSFLIQSMQLWWEFFPSTTTDFSTVLQDYSIFTIGLRSYLQFKKEEPRAEDVSGMILSRVEMYYVNVIVSHLRSSAVSEFPIMQHLVLKELHHLLDEMSHQPSTINGNLIFIQQLLRSFSIDFYLQLPSSNNLSLLFSGAVKLIKYLPSEGKTDGSDSVRISTLQLYLSTVNKCLSSLMGKNGWNSADNLHLLSSLVRLHYSGEREDITENIERMSDSPSFAHICSQLVDEILYCENLMLLEELEIFTYQSVCLEAIDSLLLRHIDSFFDLPLLILVKLMDAMPTLRVAATSSVPIKLQTFLRILHFTGNKIAVVLQVIQSQFPNDLVRSQYLMKVIDFNYQTFQSMRKLFSICPSNTMKQLVAGFLSEMMSWAEKAYKVFVTSLNTSNRCVFKKLLHLIKQRKIEPMRLTCSEVILSLVDISTTDRAELNCGVNLLMSDAVMELVFNLAEELDKDEDGIEEMGEIDSEEGNDTSDFPLGDSRPEEALTASVLLSEKIRVYLAGQLHDMIVIEGEDPLATLMVAAQDVKVSDEQIHSTLRTMTARTLQFDFHSFLKSAVTLSTTMISSATDENVLLSNLDRFFDGLQFHASKYPAQFSQHRDVVNNLLTFFLLQKTIHHLYDDSVEALHRKAATFVRSNNVKKSAEDTWKIMEYLQSRLFACADAVAINLSSPFLSISPAVQTQENGTGSNLENLRVISLNRVTSDLTILLKVVLKPNSLQYQLESEQQLHFANLREQQTSEILKLVSIKHVKFIADKIFQVLTHLNIAITAVIQHRLQSMVAHPKYGQQSTIEGCLSLHYLQLELIHHVVMLSNRSLIPNVFSKLSVVELVLTQALRMFRSFFPTLGQSTVLAMYGKSVEMFNRIMQLVSSINEYEKQYFMILVGIVNELKDPNYLHQQFYAGLFPLYGKLGKKDKNRVFYLLDSTGKEIYNQLVADYRRMYRYDEIN